MSVRILSILASMVFTACGGHKLTGPEQQGRLLLIPLPGLAATTVSSAAQTSAPRLASTSASGFDLGTIKNTTSFYFLLRNVGGTSVTSIALSSSNAAFQVTPKSIDTLPPDSTTSLLPIIKVTAVHGTATSGLGFTALMPPGANTTTVTIQGTTKSSSGFATPVRLDANMSVFALLMDVKVVNGSSEVDLRTPPNTDAANRLSCGIIVPAFLMDAKLTVQNTGNVPITVSTWTPPVASNGQQPLALGGSITLPYVNFLKLALDGGGTISDQTRLPLTPCGTAALSFYNLAVISLNDSLAFTVQPSTATHGGVITPPIQVTALTGGIVDSAFPDSVAIALWRNPTGATLSGTTVVRPVNGVASFGNLSITLPGTGYTLIAFNIRVNRPSSSATFTIQ